MRLSQRGMLYATALMIACTAAAGITYAQITGGVINGCYKSQNGQLRVSDTCLPSETAISWNQIGPQGPQGPQGAQGATGPTGPIGPSDVFDGYRPVGADIAVTGTNAARTRVLRFDLPLGSFAITSKVNVSAGTTGGGLVHCITQTTRGYFDMGTSSIGPNAGETLEATLTGTFAAIEPIPGQLTIDCWRINPVGDPPIVGFAESVAIKVGHATIVNGS
jgi:hypothetical protein